MRRRHLPWTVLALASCSPGEASRAAPRLAAPGFRFVDVAARAGLIAENVSGSPENRYLLESLGAGGAWLDHDGDGDQDLYVVNGSHLDPAPGEDLPTNHLYRNEGRLAFVDVSAEAGVADAGWGVGCAVGDVENDGDPDLYVTNFGPNILFANQGDGTFAEVGRRAGVDDARMGTSAAFGDFDADGFLDLYVANYVVFDPASPPNQGLPCHWLTYPVFCGPEGLEGEADALYRNRGNGTFEDVSSAAGIDGVKGYGLGVVFGDCDDDGDADIYVANDSCPNFLFRNDGDGTFTDIALLAGVGHSESGAEQAGMGVDFADYDNDGDPDLFVTNFSDDYNTLYRNKDGKLFSDVTAFAGLLQASVFTLGWGTSFSDFDNDGDLDLFVANGHVYPQADHPNTSTRHRQVNHLYLNGGDGRFAEVSRVLGPGMAIEASSRGIAVADADGDGDLDVLVVNEVGTPNLLVNEGGSDGNWLRVDLRGVRSNFEGIGARLDLDAGGIRQMREVRRNYGYASSQEATAHFGLGPTKIVDVLTIRWPSGTKQRLENLAPNQRITLHEDRGLLPTTER